MVIIARGAEAVIEKKDEIIIKKRVPKGYRYPELDETLRRQRTRAEARLIEKASSLTNTARLIELNESNKEIKLEYLKGKKIADCLDKIREKKQIARQVGKAIARIHDANIIHGDLTTSNMIYHDKKVHLIDFGLGFISSRSEDKAVDIHVFKEALEAKHPQNHEKLIDAFLKGYAFSKNASSVLKQLKKVELRGRYKAQY